MTKRKHKPLNPYIAGSALDGPEGFFGREDILRLVETELRSPHQNAVVLFGQRRIGKTSILLQLRRRLPESGFVPVYLDLMDRARRPLGAVLAELADNVALELGLKPPEPDRFDDEGRHFRQRRRQHHGQSHRPALEGTISGSYLAQQSEVGNGTSCRESQV